jgi:nucleotide-binding universal stress UspA family protein
MSYRSIIAAASGERDDAHVLEVAVQLAARCSAHVRVVPCFADPAADLVSFGGGSNRAPPEAMARVRAGEQEQQARIEQLAVDAAASAGVRFDGAGVGASITVEKRALMPGIALAEAAVLADLVIFGAKPARDVYALNAPFAETLLEARAPILLVKDGPFAFGAAAIAWDGSMQASRAVRGAMSFLRLTEEVVILQNLADLNTETRAAARADQLVQHLARHGVARTRAIAVEGDNIANSLVQGAREHGCTSLVAGAYGRPRLYELALGGTTRALVADDAMHLFLAH